MALTGTISANGSAAFQVGIRSGPEPLMLVLRGSWGSGTITLEASADNTNWVTCKDDSGTALSYTADCAVGVNLPPGAYYRLTLSGATGPSIVWAVC